MESLGDWIESSEEMMNEMLERTVACLLRARRGGADRTGVSERGVTLVEVLIVVAIVAMLATGVAVFALPQFKKSQVTLARTGATAIRAAVMQREITGASSCPTVRVLVTESYLDRGFKTKDPWDGVYEISCQDGDISVSSMGPDKKENTDDDIVVPKPLGEENS